MGRRTGEQTKALLIRAGMQMLLERGVSAGVQHIRLQDVLRRTGLTTGAAYRLWADQSDYQRDLAVAMMRMRVAGPADTVRSAVADLIGTGATSDEVICAGSLAHVRTTTSDLDDPTSVLDSQSFLIALALRATAHTWPELQEAAHARHRESVEAFAEFYSGLFDAFDRRLKTGLSVTDFSEALAALAEGFAIRALQGLEHPMYDFAEDDEAPTGQWTLMGIAVRALVTEFTVPKEHAEA